MSHFGEERDGGSTSLECLPIAAVVVIELLLVGEKPLTAAKKNGSDGAVRRKQSTIAVAGGTTNVVVRRRACILLISVMMQKNYPLFAGGGWRILQSPAFVSSSPSFIFWCWRQCYCSLGEDTREVALY